MSALGTMVPASLHVLDQRLREIGGCGDGDCIVVKPTGQHTNGGCRCNTDPRTMMSLANVYRTFSNEIREGYYADLAATPAASHIEDVEETEE